MKLTKKTVILAPGHQPSESWCRTVTKYNDGGIILESNACRDHKVLLDDPEAESLRDWLLEEYGPPQDWIGKIQAGQIAEVFGCDARDVLDAWEVLKTAARFKKENS